MEEKRNEGGRQQREGCTVGLLLTGFNLPLPPIFQPLASRGDFMGVCVCVCVLSKQANIHYICRQFTNSAEKCFHRLSKCGAFLDSDYMMS